MKKFLAVLFVSIFGLAVLPSSSPAQHEHGGGGGQQQSAMKMENRDVYADGMQVTFMIMRNEMHKGMLEQMKMKNDLEPGTTHDVMVLIRDEKAGKELTDVQVKLKVVGPDEKEQLKSANYKKMMRTYDAYFNLAEPGKYQVFVLFESDGQKRAIGISYDK